MCVVCVCVCVCVCMCACVCRCGCTTGNSSSPMICAYKNEEYADKILHTFPQCTIGGIHSPFRKVKSQPLHGKIAKLSQSYRPILSPQITVQSSGSNRMELGFPYHIQELSLATSLWVVLTEVISFVDITAAA